MIIQKIQKGHEHRKKTGNFPVCLCMPQLHNSDLSKISFYQTASCKVSILH
jgi:hypothetical protein